MICLKLRGINMKCYNIKIKFHDKIQYELNFHNRINFIIGDSATGKTTLVNPILDNPIKSVTLNDVDISEEYVFDAGTVPATVAALLKSNIKVVILDETQIVVNILKSEKISKYIKNKVLVIISRDMSLIADIAINGITTGTQNYYKLVLDETNVNVSKLYFEFDEPVSYSKALTEDEKSGYLFMKQICSDNVKPLYGKDNLSLVFKEDADLFMIDLCGLNQLVYLLTVIIKELNVGIVNAHSFEWVILNTNKFKNLVDLSLDEYSEKKKNLERYITELLQKSSLYEYDKNYSKGDEEYFNWLFDCGSVELLKGTKYEYLVTAYKEIKEENKAERAKRLANLLLEE